MEKPKDHLKALKKCLKDFKHMNEIFESDPWQYDMIIKLLQCEIDAVNFYRQF